MKTTNMAASERRHLDGRCKYTSFGARQEGKVACIALGPEHSNHQTTEASTPCDMRGIHFQKVNTGIVKAAIPNNDFYPVLWADAPRYPAATLPGDTDAAPVRILHNEFRLGEANNVRPEWLEFSEVMSDVKRTMLDLMTPAAAQHPLYLLDGFYGQTWMEAPMSWVSPMRKLLDIKNKLGEPNWNANTEMWVYTLCQGLSTPEIGFMSLFSYLWPDCEKQRLQKAPPTELEENGELHDGVVYCLMYGFDGTHIARGRQNERQSQHRFLLEKGQGIQSQSRSRSRSPSNSDSDSDDDNHPLHMDVIDPHRENRLITRRELLQSPNKYELKHDKLHKYFESHSPDFLLWDMQRVPDKDNPSSKKDEFTAKIICVISSCTKDQKDLHDHIKSSTEQCVQSCLGAVGCNQKLMYGLVVVIDGFILIKLEKTQSPNGLWEYEISESDIIMWDNPSSLHALFETLQEIM